MPRTSRLGWWRTGSLKFGKCLSCKGNLTNFLIRNCARTGSRFTMPEFDLRVIFFTIGQNIEIRLVKALYNLENVLSCQGNWLSSFDKFLSNCARTGSWFMRPENDLRAIFIVKLQWGRPRAFSKKVDQRFMDIYPIFIRFLLFWKAKMLIIFEVDVRAGSWFTCNFPREAISSSLTTHYDRISKVYQKIMRYIFHLLLLKNDSIGRWSNFLDENGKKQEVWFYGFLSHFLLIWKAKMPRNIWR